ncbi:MAG TPA: hypothetical protein VHX38_03900 [Pseudonocardiaceae bacterium]|jgi:hypothetical protein|nr:hypothetical protein [Pseudonocardiaceae bacterium]
MWLWPGKAKRKGPRAGDPSTVIRAPNVFGLGDGSPLVLAAKPNLARLLADPNPVAPQESPSAVWSGPASIRFALVIGYLGHPDPQVRVRAISLGSRQCGHTYGFQQQLVELTADPDPVVRLTAARAVWTVEGDTNCEQAVQSLRDEIRGYTNEFDAAKTTTGRLGPMRARAALDLLVQQAPDAPAREQLCALIDKYVVPPE